VPEIAHSTCGQTADGDEWTYTTPRVLTALPPLLSTRDVFPNGLVSGTGFVIPA
jgi:hypothetical protein